MLVLLPLDPYGCLVLTAVRRLARGGIDLRDRNRNLLDVVYRTHHLYSNVKPSQRIDTSPELFEKISKSEWISVYPGECTNEYPPC